MNTNPIVLLGKMSAGKTTIAKLLENDGFTRIITCTTRPIRPGEKDGIDYYFKSKPEFLNLKRQGAFAETVDFHATFGHVYYGSLKDSYVNNSIIVLNPNGLKKILESNIEVESFYLKVPENILRERAINRGDNIEEINRRLQADKEDFKNIENLCKYTINCFNSDTPEQIKGKIISILKNIYV